MPNKRFDESTKARAVRLVREHAGDYDSEWAAMCAISSGLGIANRNSALPIGERRIWIGRQPCYPGYGWSADGAGLRGL
jgi:hypothetical protein